MRNGKQCIEARVRLDGPYAGPARYRPVSGKLKDLSTLCEAERLQEPATTGAIRIRGSGIGNTLW